MFVTERGMACVWQEHTIWQRKTELIPSFPVTETIHSVLLSKRSRAHHPVIWRERVFGDWKGPVIFFYALYSFWLIFSFSLFLFFGMRLFIRHCLTRQPIWKRLYQTKGFPNKVGIYLSKDQQGTLSIHTNKSIFLKKKENRVDRSRTWFDKDQSTEWYCTSTRKYLWVSE